VSRGKIWKYTKTGFFNGPKKSNGTEKSQQEFNMKISGLFKAAILEKQNAPLNVANDVQALALDAGQVMVKIAFSGICGKQIDEITGKRGPDPFLPHLLGHEGSGVVVDIGVGVRKVKVGDHVVLHWMKGSGIDSAIPQYAWDGTKLNAGCVTTFEEYAVVSENRVTPIPSDIKLDIAALFGCAVMTGLGIVFNDAALKPGQSIAVFGVGGIGLNVIQGAVLVNANPIVAIDVHDGKLNKAKEFGATHLVNANKVDPVEFLMNLSDGQGEDAVVDAVGNSDVIEKAFLATKKAGKTILAGVLDHRTKINIDSYPLHFGRQLIGSHGGSAQPDTDIPRYIQLYRIGKLRLEEQITHRFSLPRINEAFEKVRNGEACRCLIEM
jgi:S-(hydroxymethyl)glutathione dehydrogenase/alcohol dehydrogenase